MGLAEAGLDADLCPIADGGEGTLAALIGERGLRSAHAVDPLGRPIETTFGLTDRGDAVVETAAASGLGLVAVDERNAVAASTTGTGQLILAAVDAGARTVYVAVGGSATTDGGRGAIEAIGDVARLRGARLVILCDVRTTFEDAAAVYGPQKGASPSDVRFLSERLQRMAPTLPRDPRGVPMTGAAGGLAGGLWAAFGAELVPGAGYVLDALRFDERCARAVAVITGEGRLDGQSSEGKAVSAVAARAGRLDRPCHAMVGRSALTAAQAQSLGLASVREAGTPALLTLAGRSIGRCV